MKTLFMPGCALSAYNPDLIMKVYSFLSEKFDDVSVIQKCCGMPTRAMGQRDLFDKRMNAFIDEATEISTERIITACPGCHSVLEHCGRIPVISLWEVMIETGIPEQSLAKGSAEVLFSVHDPCSIRYNATIHKSVRNIIQQLGYGVEPTKHEKKHTLCCGHGGTIGKANPKMAAQNTKKCLNSYKSKNIVVYCANCKAAFDKEGSRTWHLLDLIWGEAVTSNSAPPKNALLSPISAWKNGYKTKAEIKRTYRQTGYNN